MYRLYLDEVGTDDLGHTHIDNHRYLSLTGVAIEIDHARDFLSPKFDRIKARIFDHDPDDPIHFHRSDIVQRKKQFWKLNDEKVRELFDRLMFHTFENCQFSVITALIDKHEMMQKSYWQQNHPYHFAMSIIVEKYTQFLERKSDIGDIMPEGRKGKKDKQLQLEFNRVRNEGTSYVNAERIQQRIPGSKLKIRYKRDNIAGLQLCDLIAHPSHMNIREMREHDVALGKYARRVSNLLQQSKYDRSNWGKVNGYGIKYFP